ncbi:hypothetical protein ALC62_02755 [Cyphomyrmex costatus]|uniref:Uncharacterized protein n=1 Tax=Cyphomyrmex costatus TaxID=456900 RepID=A0A151IMS8_9HYME|nr:hypothetical protein ALC62_02755 [Cyphomyrmex costatus]
MGKTVRLFITLPAEVWAIALKPLVFLDRVPRRRKLRTEPPPPLSSLMAGKEQLGRLLVRTFVSCRRGHAKMWPSTCSQGFEARAHARTRAHYREGSG